MSQKILALTLLAVIGFSISLGVNRFPVTAQNTPLAPYRWQNRLLLVFIPEVSDARLAAIEQTIDEVQCEFQARDLLLGVFPTDAPSRIGSDSISAYNVAALRAKYGIRSDQFALLLIGKDGQPKSELSSVPEIEQIFGRIDTMPMRQQEMVNRPNPCQN